MKVTAVVPARDEADGIGATVRALRSFADRVVVVDDASADPTGAVAREAGADVLRLGRRVGKGGALERALDRIAPLEGVVVLADADLGESAASLGALPTALADADLAIAVLPPQGGGFGIVKRFARWSIRLLGSISVTEPLSGQRALSAENLERLRPLASGFGVETAMSIDAGRAGMRVVEVPLPLYHRPSGRDPSGFIHRGKQGRDIAWAVLLRLLRIRP